MSQDVVINFVDEIEPKFRSLPSDAVRPALRLLAKRLSPKRKGGRPRSERVTRAEDLLNRGFRWTKIYPLAIPGYWALSPAEREVATAKLRKAVAARMQKLGCGVSSGH